MNLPEIDHVIFRQYRHVLQRAEGDSTTKEKPRPFYNPSLPERKAGSQINAITMFKVF